MQKDVVSVKHVRFALRDHARNRWRRPCLSSRSTQRPPTAGPLAGAGPIGPNASISIEPLDGGRRFRITFTLDSKVTASVWRCCRSCAGRPARVREKLREPQAAPRIGQPSLARFLTPAEHQPHQTPPDEAIRRWPATHTAQPRAAGRAAVTATIGLRGVGENLRWVATTDGDGSAGVARGCADARGSGGRPRGEGLTSPGAAAAVAGFHRHLARQLVVHGRWLVVLPHPHAQCQAHRDRAASPPLRSDVVAFQPGARLLCKSG